MYAVEFSFRAGRDLVELAHFRSNVVPILGDARDPSKYRMLVNGLVDCIYIDVEQPDMARILTINAQHYLRAGGGFIMIINVHTFS